MRVGLIVDSACDLPYSFIRENDIYILPITVHVDGQTYIDDHDPAKTQTFYDSGLLARGHDAETVEFSPAQISELFLREIVTQYDFAFLETASGERSSSYNNAFEAMHRIVAEYRRHREAAGRTGPFSMRVVDSRALFAGQGVLAAHTASLIKQGIPKNELRTRIDAFTANIHFCVMPRDLYFLRKRGRKRGDRNVSGAAAFLGKALNVTPIIWGRAYENAPVANVRGFEAAVARSFAYACRRIRKGLLTPYLCVSACMSEQELERLPGYDELRTTCREQGVELLATRSSITTAIYLGPGSLGLAFAAEPHHFNDD
jgi:DegV family protein with EDD domain